MEQPNPATSATFAALSLPDELLRAVSDLGFETPTPVQREVIPFLLSEDRDLIALAQTGTGKTAAYGLPLLARVEAADPIPRGLVLCPTRELCNQIAGDLRDYARHLPGVRVVAVYGGASISAQCRALRDGAQIVVATPGRLVDLGERGAVDLSGIRVAILDEADEMLDMGFRDELNAILERTPGDKRTWIFSATMPPEIAAMTGRFLKGPKEISVGERNSGAENIEHIAYRIRERDRTAAVKRVIDAHPEIYGLVFCRTREETRDLSEALARDGYDADALHGDMSQPDRDKVMKRFKERRLRLLVATDVAARGLDVEGLTHVVHFRLPDFADGYIHRSGRTARAGRSGVSIAFVNLREERRRKDIEYGGGFRFRFERIPSGDDVCARQLLAHAKRLLAAPAHVEEMARFLPPVLEALAGIDREELIRRFLALEFERILLTSRAAEDLNPEHSERGARDGRDSRDRFDRGDRRDGRDSRDRFDRDGAREDRPRRSSFVPREPDKDMVRLRLDVGKKDNIPAGAILRLLCELGGVKSDAVGRIDLRHAWSVVDVKADVAGKMLANADGAEIDRRAVNLRRWIDKPYGADRAGRSERPERPERPAERERPKPSADRKPNGDRKPYDPDRPKFDKPGDDKPKFSKDGPKFEKPNYGKDRPAYDKPKYERKPKFDKPIYDKPRPDAAPDADAPVRPRKPVDPDRPKFVKKDGTKYDKPAYGKDKPKFDKKPFAKDAPASDKPKFAKKKYDKRPPAFGPGAAPAAEGKRPFYEKFAKPPRPKPETDKPRKG